MVMSAVPMQCAPQYTINAPQYKINPALRNPQQPPVPAGQPMSALVRTSCSWHAIGLAHLQ